MTMLEGGVLERIELDEAMLYDDAQCQLQPRPHRLVLDHDTTIVCGVTAFGVCHIACLSTSILICQPVYEWADLVLSKPSRSLQSITLGWVCTACRRLVNECWSVTKA